MDLWTALQALILGVVEGLTEFLPISSTGHQIIVADLLNFGGERAIAFNIIIQLGAILAVVWEFRRKIFDVVLGLPTQPGHYRKGPRARGWTFLGTDIEPEARWAMVLERPPEKGWRHGALEAIGGHDRSPAVQAASRRHSGQSQGDPSAVARIDHAPLCGLVQINDHTGPIPIGAETHGQHVALGAPGETARRKQGAGADDHEGQGGHRPLLRAPAHQTCQNATAHLRRRTRFKPT